MFSTLRAVCLAPLLARPVLGAVLSIRQNLNNPENEAGMGLANSTAFQFGVTPMRGVNAGGW
jgi:hypothetical protein